MMIDSLDTKRRTSILAVPRIHVCYNFPIRPCITNFFMHLGFLRWFVPFVGSDYNWNNINLAPPHGEKPCMGTRPHFHMSRLCANSESQTVFFLPLLYYYARTICVLHSKWNQRGSINYCKSKLKLVVNLFTKTKTVSCHCFTHLKLTHILIKKSVFIDCIIRYFIQ